MSSNFPWCALAFWLFGQFPGTDLSIAGVTYRDHFDFEERYSKDHECDPMHWYPLHLPDKCIDKYAKIIRSRISAQKPYKIIIEKENAEKKKQAKEEENALYDVLAMSSVVADQNMYEYEADKPVLQEMGYLAQEPPVEKIEFPPWFPPHLLMIEKIRQDVRELPALPVLGFLPNIGLAAIYQQPVSDDTKDTINNIASKYAAAMRKFYEEAKVYPILPPFNDKHNNNGTNTTTELSEAKDEPDKKSKEFDVSSEDPGNKKRDYEILKKEKLIIKDSDITSTTKDPNRQVVRKKIEMGNFVAYIEQKKVIGKNYGKGKISDGNTVTKDLEPRFGTGIEIEAET